MAATKRILCVFLFSLVQNHFLFAQSAVPALERIISINASNEPLADVLENISRQGHFSFSYNPQVVDAGKRISIRLKNKTVREALDLILGPEVQYKMKGEHIILTASGEDKKNASCSWYMIKGYVTDGNNGEKIPEVSVYDKSSRASAITNKFGFYELKVDRKANAVQLIVNKQQFKDTLIYVRQSGNATINVTIYPEEKESSHVDSTAILEAKMKDDQLAFMNFILTEEQKVNTKNVKDTLYKKFQLAFVPFLGSNLRLSGNTVNDYSLNVLAGYSLGTRKLELAGLINIDRDSVKSVQVAGLINAVGGPVEGIQAAGLLNANLHGIKGVQLAGLINSNGDTMHGFEAAGLLNVNLNDVHGFAVAGLLNSTFGKTEGIQAAGLLNFSLHEIKGVQVAGLMNVCMKDITGTQVTGLVNYAGKISGSQLGFLNIADSCSGIPVGFLSFVNRGYHSIEISADEVFLVNLSFRTGVRKFYNIFSSGIKTNDFNVPLWHFGYGLGTSISIGKKWWLNFDLTTQQLVKGGTFEQMNLLSKFNLTIEKSILKKAGIAFGPVFNFYTSNATVPYYSNVFDKIPPYTFSNQSYSHDLNIKTWLSGKVALRFL